MTEDQKSLIGRLARCRMLPGDWDKMFIKSLCRLASDAVLSEARLKQLDKLHYKYRKQLGEPDYPRPAWMKPRVNPRTRNELIQLAAWNAGKPKDGER